MRMISFVKIMIFISFALFKRARASSALFFVSPSEGDIFHVGSQVYVQVSGTDTISPQALISVVQDCDGNFVGQDLTVGTQYSGTFQLPAGYTGPCSYISNGRAEVNILVQNSEGLAIVSPTASSPLIIGTPFDTLITTTDPDVRLPISLIFTGNPTQRISGTTNVQQWVTLDSSYLGSNSLSIASGPLTFPVSIPIVLKYGFEFIVAPTFIVKGVPFNLLLQTSDIIVNPAPSTIPLFLTCGNTLVYSWTGVSLNQLTRLAPIPNDSNTDQLNCILSTEANSQFFYQILRSVSLVSSPFRAQLRPITPEQQAQFAISIAIPPGEFIASG